MSFSTYRQSLQTSKLAGEVARFIVGGILNSAVGYGSYLILLHWLRYEASFTISYIIGIIVSYIFNATCVFRQPMGWRSAIRYPIVYLIQYVLGLLLLKTLVEGIHIPTKLAPLVVTILTIPATFVTSRIILRKN